MKSLFYPFWKKKRRGYSYKKRSASSRVWSLSNEVNDLRQDYYNLNNKIRELAEANGMTWKEGFVSAKNKPGRPKKQKPDFICR